ncbi:histidine phosphatase family protein [Serratia rubidaea]|uniref:histidine phosphatase family protein n=1 Tax=Serratia rubidaea TaxID=61652 RepID=UPI00242F05E3|nr:histidine phosphatase family protein [Serratia rubidaea]MCR0999250.1 histidine phosphatase family protein [Serratia rubidaea]
MEIILMRHGKPSYTGSAKVASRAMADWVTQYNLSDTGSDTPPESSQLMASNASQVISSPLPRALSSLKALGREPDFINELFREAELPLFPIPIVRLSPLSWTVIFRVMWLCGISRQAERLGMAKTRAAKAADILVARANGSNGSVLLMGHGVMIQLIARELISLGWKQHRRLGKEYWSAGIYRLS